MAMPRDPLIRRLCLGVVVMIALVGVVKVMTDGHRQRVALRHGWSKADGEFRQAAFTSAESRYKDLQSIMGKSADAENPPFVLARDMQELVTVLKDLQVSFGARDGSALHPLRKLRDLRSKFATSGRERGTSSNRPVVPPNLEVDADGLNIALSFQREERWIEALKWMESQGLRVTQSLAQQNVPNVPLLEVVDELMGLCETSGRDVTELQKHRKNTQQRCDYQQCEASFLTFARSAEATLSEADVGAARAAWLDLQRQFPELAGERLWNGHRETLRRRLLQEVRDSIAPGANGLPPLPGRRNQQSPEVLPCERFAKFIPVYITHSVVPTGEFVCVRHEDRCYALEAHTGAVRWICRVGYDCRWFPVHATAEGHEFVLLQWEAGGVEAITLASAVDLAVRWTWELPPGVTFAGPPVVLGSRLFVELRTGELWEFQLETGQPRSFLKLPQPAGGPIAVRIDKRGAALIDRQMAVYVIDFTEPPQCRDVVLSQPSTNTLDAWVIWMSPFLLVCENDLTDRCRVIVLRESESGFEEVQREEINGRLWQPPVAKGQSILLATDLGWESVHTLRPQSEQPMFTVFQQSSRTPDWPRLPQLLLQPDTDFVAAIDARIVRYAINPLEPRHVRQREALWEHQFPVPDCVPTQPLQATALSIIGLGQSSREAPSYVRAIDREHGQLQWTARVGNYVVEQFAPDDKAPVLFRTATGDMYRQSSMEPYRLTHLAHLSYNETVDYSPVHYALASVDSSPPELRVQTPEGVDRPSIPLTHPAIAPVAFWDGPLTTNGMDESEPARPPGPWVAILDAGRQLHVKNLNPKVITQFAQASRELPSEGWWRPQWIQGKAVVISHPRGDITLFQMMRDQRVIYPKEVRHVRIKAGLASRPIEFDNAIWVACRDDHLRVFNADDLELRRDIQLPYVPSSPPAVTTSQGGDLAVIGLSNGHVAITVGDDSEVRYDVPVSKYAIRHVMVTAEIDQIWAVDARGAIIELSTSGMVLRRQQLSGEVSATPVRYSGHWLLPTTAGELVRWPIPGKDVQ